MDEDEYTGPERRREPCGRRHVDMERRWLDRLAMPMLGLGMILLIISIAYGVGALGGLKERRNSEYEACLRVQALRDQVNVLNGVVYGTLNGVKLAAERAGEVDPATALRADLYQTYADTVQFLPATDCTKATDDPVNYRGPGPIPYHEYIEKGGEPPVPLPPPFDPGG